MLHHWSKVEGARFNVEVNGGVPAHIDESFDKCTQHLRISNPYEFRVKSSLFITAVVANRDEMKDIKGAAVSANLLGDCIFFDQGAAGTSGALVMALKMCTRSWCILL
jgi:hypothetical protein